MSTEYRIGQGWDLHRLVVGRPLVLGGITIDHDKGLSGHSDADVLVHAVIDALLGALADRDIGSHFPDGDPAWRDARSIDMLRTVAERIRLDGWQAVNVDSTIIAEAPRLAVHRDAMRKKIASALEIAPAAVSVKAKTAEGVGAEGAGEAVSAQVVVLLGRG
jgi:2-C-methyl-D-erythritol 2,4-cyclodiphosphate synthase